MFYHLKGPITLRRGDAVYVRAENGKNLIAQIDAMWTAADGMAYFHGPWFVTPKETPHPPKRTTNNCTDVLVHLVSPPLHVCH